MAEQRRGRQPQMPAEEKQFDERVINIDRVARVVKGGRRFRFRALVVAGDHKGKVGIGVSKGADVTAAIAKAVDVAKKNMDLITMSEGTIPHEVESKISGAKILIKPAAPGTGLIAGGVVRTVLEVAGVHNALSKRLGGNNKINTAYATLEALKSAVPAEEWVTRQSSSSVISHQSSVKTEQTTDNRRQTTDNRQQTTEDRRQTTPRRQKTTSKEPKK